MSDPERRPLTRERILAAAMRMVDANGVDALSMRKLGASLGVEAMSLYNHVANKDDVLNGILDLVLAEIEIPDPALPWDQRLRALAQGFRQAGHDHPGVFPMFGARPIRSIAGLLPLECAYSILRDAGLDQDEALDAFTAMSSFVFGFVLTELGGLVDVGAEPGIEITPVDPEAHPRLVEMGAALARRDADRHFAFGLEQLLAGLGRMIEGATPVA